MPVTHEPWLLQTAHIMSLESDFVKELGTTSAGAPEHVRFSSGVTALFGRPQRVTWTTRIAR